MGISNLLHSQFGVQSCRVMSQQAERHEAIGKQIASTYPLIHERTLALYLQYLEHKCQWGKCAELLAVYDEIPMIATASSCRQRCGAARLCGSLAM